MNEAMVPVLGSRRFAEIRRTLKLVGADEAVVEIPPRGARVFDSANPAHPHGLRGVPHSSPEVALLQR